MHNEEILLKCGEDGMMEQERLEPQGTQPVWVVPPEPGEEIRQLALQVGLPIPLVQVLYQRGLQTQDAIEQFLHPERYPLHKPQLLKGMSEAVARLATALSRAERILVYGDYDVDGQVSTALLVAALQRLGGTVDYYIPHRLTEGYGVSADALERLAPHTDLIVTVDCGITSVQEVELARSLGVDVIITDHHEPGPELPAAAAVIDPKQPDCPYPEKSLAGCAVVFKLVQALYEHLGKNADEVFAWIDLVAVGTIADVVPLQGENRALVWRGLPKVRARLGLDKLLAVAGIDDAEPTAGQIAFLLAPRLNAVGRLADASPGVELLLTDDPSTAERIARELERENNERRQIEQRILEEADAWVQAHADLAEDRALVVAGEGWHPGVIGIVASRLVERYHRPAIVLAIDGEKAVGSGRSVPGFDLYGALRTVQHLLMRFGGHRAAAGLTIATNRIDAFRQAFQAEAARWLGPDDLVPVVRIDAMLTPESVDHALVETIARFAPFGYGNPEPVFGLERVQVIESRGVGKGDKHWRLRVQSQASGTHVLTGIGFDLGPDFLPHVRVGDRVSLAATLGLNNWQGRSYIQLRLKDARVHSRTHDLAELARALRHVSAGGSVLTSAVVNGSLTYGALALQPETIGSVEKVTWVGPQGERVEFAAIDCRFAAVDQRMDVIAATAHEANTLLVWAEGVNDAQRTVSLHRLEVSAYPSAAKVLLCMDRVPLKAVGSVQHDKQRTVLVFWDVPRSLEQLRQSMLHAGSWSPLVDVYLTFTSERIAEARRRLAADYPPIEVLRHIFVEVRQRCRHARRPLDTYELCQVLLERGHAVTAAGIRYALEVFEEAGLVSVDFAGSEAWVVMREPPSGKVDLRLGVRYNEGEAKRSQFAHFATWLRSASLTDLIAQTLHPER